MSEEHSIDSISEDQDGPPPLISSEDSIQADILVDHDESLRESLSSSMPSLVHEHEVCSKDT